MSNDVEAPTISGQALTLKPGPSQMILWEIGSLVGRSPMRANAAALGYCLRKPVALRTRTTIASAGHDVAVFGQQVFDELLAKGHDPAEVLAAGRHALRLVSEATTLPSAEEVEAAEGFSAAGGE
jgi:hypothetical protein